MQELRSTDIIDKEIHSDAVRKVEKILKKAEIDSKAIIDSIDSAVEKEQAEKKEFLDKKLQAFEKDQNASIPLEKQRFMVSFVQKKIEEGINIYLNSLSEEKRLELVTHSFDFSTDKKINAFVYGFNEQSVQKFLEKKLGKKLLKCEKTVFGKVIVEDDFGLEKPEGIVLESEDKSFRYRLTMSQVIGEVINKYRAELSDALFGGQL